jgi:alpha-L-rhamnosidase
MPPCSAAGVEGRRLITPTHLLCEYLADPLGLDTPRPRFSWEVRASERGAVQTARQVVVGDGPESLEGGKGLKWDSGTVASGASTQVAYGGPPLASRERCAWKVRCWNGDGEAGPWSAAASFEMGLTQPSDWHGDWIGAEAAVSALLLRKAFALAGQARRARAYVSGLGFYELYLNGRRVGDHVLDPGWTDFDRREMRGLLYPHVDRSRKRVLYATYDVTDLLRAGANAVGVWLGNGWYNQRGRTVEGKLWYGTPRAILELAVEYADGGGETIVSDASWKCAASEITANHIFLGEEVDARLAKPGWSRAEYDDSAWVPVRRMEAPAGRLVAQVSPPDKIIERIKAVRMGEPAPEVFVYDMGRNFSGWARLKVRGPAGTRVVLRFAEEVDGRGLPDFESAGGDGQIQRDAYVLGGGGPESYEPRFTWHTFRYVEMTGCPGTPDLESLEGVVVHSALEPAGTFACSSALVNRVQETYRRTQLAAMHGGVPMDCPHRERLGYTGDGQLTCESAMFNFWAPQFYAKWTNDLSDAQDRETGFVPHTAPFNGGGGGPAWGSACVIVPWALYCFYGDRMVLEDHYGMMTGWLRYLGTRTDDGAVVVREEPGSWCLGDWCVPTRAGEETGPPPELVNTYVHARVARLMTRVARVLGRTDDAAAFEDLADRVSAAFHARFRDPETGDYASGKHGANAFGLAMDPPSKEERQRTLDRLMERLRVANQGHLDTGIVGTPVLLDLLVACGREDAAWEIVTKTTFPSYGYMLERGATTLWESWSGDGSHCHPMFGSVSGWLFRHLAGIQPDPAGPGFERIVIRPVMPRGLASAAASVRTLRGTVAVDWKKGDGPLRLEVAIPGNSTARVYVPTLGAKAVRITEGGRPVWEGCACCPGVPGIAGAEATPGGVVVTVGGGTYRFEVAGSG